MSIDKVEHLRMIATKHMPDEFDCWFVPSTAVMKDLCEAACELADLIESREKAEPVAWVKVPAGEQASDRYPGYSFNCIECLPAGNHDLYTHPPTTPTGATQAPVVDEQVAKDVTKTIEPGSVYMKEQSSYEEEMILFEKEFQMSRFCHAIRCGASYAVKDQYSDPREADYLNYALIGWQARAKLGQTTDKACSAVVPDGWKFSVTVCDGRHWLTITTPDGRNGATLSCQSEHSSGKTISAQVLELFEAAMLKGEK